MPHKPAPGARRRARDRARAGQGDAAGDRPQQRRGLLRELEECAARCQPLPRGKQAADAEAWRAAVADATALLRAAHAALRLQESAAQCVVCMSEPAVMACEPCLHLCACPACAETLLRVSGNACPKCRGPVREWRRVFLP